MRRMSLVQKRAALLTCLVIGLSMAPRAALASTITLTPGTSTGSVPLNLSGFPANQLANTGFLPFSSGGLSGTFEARAFQDGSFVDFLFLVTDNATTATPPSFDEIYGLTLSGFKGFITSVAFDNFPAGGITPSAAAVSANGNDVTFSFLSPEILPGQRSFWVEIDTNAPSFQAGTATIIAGAVDIGSVVSLAPVPEPSTWTLFACGLGLLGATLRRRRLATEAQALDGSELKTASQW